MNKQDVLNKIMSVGIVPVVRMSDGAKVLDAAGALIEGGIPIMEVTMSSPRPFEIIQNLKVRFGENILV